MLGCSRYSSIHRPDGLQTTQCDKACFWLLLSTQAVNLVNCRHSKFVNACSSLPLIVIIYVFSNSSACLWHSMMWCFLLLTAAIAVTGAAFGQGTGPIYLHSVGCTGTESSLLSCSHIGIGVTYCGHYYDAGVVCPSCKLVSVIKIHATDCISTMRICKSK